MNIPEKLTISLLREAYASARLTPEELVSQIWARADACESWNIWTHRLTPAELQPWLDRLRGKSVDDLPLYGIPFAIKDNLDLAGVPTTAGCPAYRYLPDRSAYVVNLLLEAGAIPIGKTNLDQFATGLVGVRSPEPFGVCRNSIDPDYISGGSSSGSAVAVGKGLVSFSLGTDTAGSGRVPAAFNNLFGVKPSKGLLSTSGLVPACRTLDCVTLFANEVADSELLLELTADYDRDDCYARAEAMDDSPAEDAFTFAVPQQEQLAFFGNAGYQQLFERAIEQLQARGGTLQRIDFAPFLECARLLYEGPWVAERYAAIEQLMLSDPDTLHPTIRAIIEPATSHTAVEAFKAEYRRAALQRQCAEALQEVDFLFTPTAGTIYRVDEVLAEPITLNSNLGYYTNFMNLLDLAAVAVPAGFTDEGLPFGVTIAGPALSDRRLLAYARMFRGEPAAASAEITGQCMPIAVCGAHLSGMPLNGQLTALGATLSESTTTSRAYRLYALAGGPPHRPGLARVGAETGQAIEVEVWQVPVARFGEFMLQIPPPLGIGSVELADGSWVNSFICEPCGLEDAKDISGLGSWRNFRP